MPGIIIPDTSFRTRQAVSDLVAHVKPLLAPSFGALAKASGLTMVQIGEAIQLLRDDGFTFSRDETFALLDGLENLASAQGEGFELSVVVLLADLLQTRQASDLLTEAWKEAQSRLRGWPETLRAAVASGLRMAIDLRLVAQVSPAPTDTVTREAGAIAEPLLRIARAMRPDELIAVATMDPGQDADTLHDALKDMIRNRDGIFPKGQSGFLEKAVTLAAGDADAPGFEGSTALLLLNALHNGGGARSVFSADWEARWAAYGNLRPSARDPILAGFRYVYEMAPHHWDVEATAAPIPVVHDLT